MNDKTEFSPKRCGVVYFQRIELFMILLLMAFSVIPVLILVVFSLYYELMFFLIFVGLIGGSSVVSAVKRARFIRTGGIYRVSVNNIEWVWPNGKVEYYDISQMQCKIRKRLGRMDILFGKNFIDSVKHYGSKKSQGAAMYSIDLEQLVLLKKVLNID